jgi:lipopolysaccharide/colanic/teichoic acid biosynthesis glycosyltransferase
MLKRLFDIIVSLAVLLLLMPVIIVLIVLVRVLLGSPVLFSQQRPGKDNKPFNMLKFRSMSDQRDSNGKLLSDEKRLGKFGQFIRAASLDELPGLLNVIRGDMSLVGPRPLLMEYLPLYSKAQARRHDMKPGITGWAQINGRNALSWEQKFEYDLWYIDNQSFILDLKILLLTFTKVIRRADITHAGEATMKKFTGSNAAETTND